ncbi:alpha/beta-hydrolase [Cristinia sonorae]|uniref:Alpha/beta-hydrolase n=1 Tax=Cristinia sonorae TaxID=1940300 RepID=A0A8K0XK93_9AGAR|nr:alpha/beta-hydrolase [Cristinia sonorae]
MEKRKSSVRPFEDALLESRKDAIAKRSRRWHLLALPFLVWAGLHALRVFHSWSKDHQVEQGTVFAKEFNWTKVSGCFIRIPHAVADIHLQIEPSEELKWTPCYEELECARFSVPLDYKNPSAGSAAIALLRSASPLPQDHKDYKGPILFNPGGPGGSGTATVRALAGPMRRVLGDGYDLLGFDPRGTGYTTPEVNLYNSLGEIGLFGLQMLQTTNYSDPSFGAQYGAMKNLGNIAKERIGNVGQYLGTPAVARDMLSIITAHGQDKLNYWGFSYGTVLGATFAAMFPNNVGRLVLDGVVDSEDYYEGRWAKNLEDTDAGLWLMYQDCVDSGPFACAFHESTAQAVSDRVDALLEKVRYNPVPFYNSEAGVYGLVDHSTVRRFIFTALYNPLTTSNFVFLALALLEKGQSEFLWYASGNQDMQTLITAPCVCPSPSAGSLAFKGWETVFSIACGDAQHNQPDIDALRKDYENMSKDSSFTDCWSIRMGCSGWKIQAAEPFNASFNTNTSYPILFIGNTADPVTPVSNAHKMSKGFANSVVLTQKSGGHCSISAPSYCTAKYVREYFVSGTLPKEGTKCDVHKASGFASSLNFELTAEEAQLLEASAELQSLYPVYIPFMPIR